MKANRLSFGLLLLALVILFIPTIAAQLSGGAVDPHVTQLIGFTLTLITLFGGAYFAAFRLERQIEEDRNKEIRAYKMKMLEQINSWTSEFRNCLDEIRSIRELSVKDDVDGKLIVDREKLLSIADDLIRLDTKWLLAFAKAADIVGVGPDSGKFTDLPKHHQELLTGLYTLGSQASEIKDMLISSDKIPGVDHLSATIAKVTQCLDKIQQLDL